ncbi:MAG: sugar phosphate isomerase/epimerase, partial [Methanoregula sp.]|nr:sugar phosphate isomerase/epimerase [Methanoregula sp.]
LAAGEFCHVHLHDNGGTVDDHLACGTGTINFSETVQRLPSQATLVVETRELLAADQSVRYLSTLMNGEE